VKIDALLLVPPAQARERAEALAATGVDGLFTFEGPHDVFLPLILAAETGCDLYTNVAIAFPRSPMHLAHQSWDLAALSGGRFALGLGTQVKAHIERRYGATWSSPVARMAEWIGALRAIGARWQDGAALAFEGVHTRHTLMTPAFDPGPLPGEPPPIWLGALGPKMVGLATAQADGLLVHPFTSDRHLADVTRPRIAGGLRAAGRDASDLTIVGQAVVACASDPAQQSNLDAATRWLVGFYGSTPAYLPVLEAEGREHLHPELRRLSREGRWDEMAAMIDDDLLNAVVVRGDPDQVAARLVDRFAGFADRIALSTPGGIADHDLAAVVAAVRRLTATGPSVPSAATVTGTADGAITVRDATDDDLAAMAEIYDHVIATSDSIWYDDPLGVDVFAAKIAPHLHGDDPVLVAVDDGGEVVAYASGGPFRTLPGYATTVEHSIFVGDGHQGRGIGQRLLDALAASARSAGKAVMVAAIDGGNTGSIRFHERNGFVEVARMPGVGRKHGRSLDLVLLQRTLEPDPRTRTEANLL
jgi:probable F420-dependent oxidoreductase